MSHYVTHGNLAYVTECFELELVPEMYIFFNKFHKLKNFCSTYKEANKSFNNLKVKYLPSSWSSYSEKLSDFDVLTHHKHNKTSFYKF